MSLRIIEKMNPASVKEEFLVACEDQYGNQTYADFPAQPGSPSFTEWPHSLWGWFPTHADATAAVERAGLRELN